MSESGSDAVDVEDGPFDWLGNPVSCADCPYEETRAAGRCDLGKTCVMDRRARRIDRFFAANPAQAERHLDHPYFEVRTLAARYASPFRLVALIDDPEPDVRAMVALRLPLSRVGALARDPEPRVRIALAPAPERRGAGGAVRRRRLFRASGRGAARRAGAAASLDPRSRSVGAPEAARRAAGLCAGRHDRRSRSAGAHRGRRTAARRGARADGERRGLSRPLRLRRTPADRSSRQRSPTTRTRSCATSRARD